MMLGRVSGSSLVVLLLCLGRPSSACADLSTPKPNWVLSLESDGWLVQEGEFGIYDIPTCKRSDTCYALNPLTPYGLPWLPNHPNETASKIPYENTCHKHKLCRNASDGTFLSPDWRLAEGEVVVAAGLTPPESVYFSFTSYLYTRYHGAGWKNNATLGRSAVACPDGPSRCENFLGINDPVNHLTIKTDDGVPFSSGFSLLLTTDKSSEDEVVSHMKSGKAGAINTLRFPGAILNLGVQTGFEDELLNVMRLEGIKNATERENFYANPTIRVWRLTPPATFVVKDTDRFASFEGRMKNRFTHVGEHAPEATFEELKDGLEALAKAVEVKHGSGHGIFGRDYVTLDFESFVKDSGYECLADGTRCQGDCRDTIYAKGTLLIQDEICNSTGTPCKPARRSALTQSQDDTLFVMGVNHQLTSQSLYSSVTAYDFPKLASGQLKDPTGRAVYAQMESSSLIKGSAAKYLPHGHNAVPYLYVLKFSRNCTGEAFDLCYEVDSMPSSRDDLAIALGSPIIFIERMYVHPKTLSGPAVNETVLPKLIHFRKNAETEVQSLAEA